MSIRNSSFVIRPFLLLCIFAPFAFAQEWASSLTRTPAGPLAVPPWVLDFELGWNNTNKAGTWL